MALETISQVTSSKTTLRIADLVSTRPRTLTELSDLTGISIQGVLKHLKKLEKLGLAKGLDVEGSELRVRRLYSPGKGKVGDYSVGDLAVVRLSSGAVGGSISRRSVEGLEALAEDAIVQRSRISEQVRRLGRMIDDLVGLEASLAATLESLELDGDEKLILYTYFTEVTPEDAVKTLSRYYGLSDARKAIAGAMSKVSRVAKK
jgi:DNA-binding Lrp family transcriptional regulator